MIFYYIFSLIFLVNYAFMAKIDRSDVLELKRFSSKLNSNLSSLSLYFETYPIIGVYPFGVALTLAQYEKILPQELTTGINDLIIQNKSKSTADIYSNILNFYLNDTNLKVKSNFYIGDKKILKYAAIRPLLTENISVLNFSDPESSKLINSNLKQHTQGEIENLLPTGGWYGPPAPNDNTKWVSTNTLTYSNTWITKLLKIRDQNFAKDGKVKFFEYRGPAKVINTEFYTTISVPLSGYKKDVIFAIPKKRCENLEELLNIYDEVLKDFKNINENAVRIQIPEIILKESGLQYSAELKSLGLNKTFCKLYNENGTKNEYVVHEIHQKFSLGLSAEKFKLSIAQGNSVDDWINYEETTSPRKTRNAQIEEKKMKKSTTTVANCATKFQNVKERRRNENTKGSLYRLDNPFLISLNDGLAGNIFSGIIMTTDNHKDESAPEGFEWLYDAKLYKQWYLECRD